MRINLALWDRALRFLAGTLLAAWAIAGGPWWAYVGIYFVVTSSWGICPIYAMLNIKTHHLSQNLPQSSYLSRE